MHSIGGKKGLRVSGPARLGALSGYPAVIFDMDGVITNTMPYHLKAWEKIFFSLGVKVTRFDIYKREGQDGLTSVKEIFLEHKMRLTDAEARGILADKEVYFKRVVKRSFVKGARPFLRILARRGVRLALVTGTSRHEMEKILPRSLRALFEVSVTGDEVRQGKPYPEPFLKALGMYKLPARKAMVIENAPFGIKAAKRAGLYCVALETSLPRTYLTQADRVVRSFEELHKLF